MEQYNPTKKCESIDDLERYQKDVNDRRKQYFDSLNLEEQNKLKVIEEVSSLLEKNKIKFALVACPKDVYFEFHKVEFSDNIEDKNRSWGDEFLGKIVPTINSFVHPNIKNVIYYDNENQPFYGNKRGEHGYMIPMFK